MWELILWGVRLETVSHKGLAVMVWEKNIMYV